MRETTEREHRMSLRLDDEELYLRDALARLHGIDRSGVMRQALRRWAREEGIHLPEPGKKGKSAH